ncbi:MAG: cysteine dioxygenase family protein [Acidobacteria bacterium]|nr:cysteine dioxygenase family protein [Acidobacteriota bacterium]
MEHLAISDWVERLAAIREKDFTIERVHAFHLAHGVRPETLEKYSFYSKGNYTRNLIYKCPLFEVLLICWEIGQASRIHNHRDQNCWMSVPIGRLRVQNFRVEQRDPARGACRLVPTDAFDMDPARPAYVDPQAPVHQVLNRPEFGQRAATVHVYSRPYDSCEIYQPEKGVYFDVDLHYTSEYGKLNPEERLL